MPALVSKKFRRALQNGCFEKIHIIHRETSAKGIFANLLFKLQKIFRTIFSKCTSRKLLMYVKITLKVIIFKKQSFICQVLLSNLRDLKIKK